MTGSGDNRSTSPTIPLNSRVSGKEKRRRVHAWLGAQTRPETESTMLGASPSCQGVAKFPNLPAPELPLFATGTKIGVDSRTGSLANPESKEESDLLQSNSEFIPGDASHSYQRNFQGVHHAMHSNNPPLAVSSKNRYTPDQTALYKYHAQCQSWNGKVAEDTSRKVPAADLSGGGESYCYLYDPVVAKAYTKKYNVSPSINTPPPSAVQTATPYDANAPVIKYIPASQNFTPSPMMYEDNVPTTNSHLTNGIGFANAQFNKYPEPYSRTMHQGSHAPINAMSPFHLATKYEEYDSRPIKPLDSNLKKSLYGEAVSENEPKQATKVHQPRPYLRRSHTSGVSYPIPRARSHEKPTATKVHRVQANVDSKRKVGYMRGSPRASPMSPRHKRISRPNPKEKAVKHEKKKSVEPQEDMASEADLDKTPRPVEVEETTLQPTELPVDLKHVKAATKIQAVWKGFRTRKLDPKVVQIRQEVRARRAEQYISVLCHEVQCMKDNLEAERKMRDLQTEAIRYIWSQLRVVQKQRNGAVDDKREKGKRKSPDRRARSKSNSPRRGTKRGNKRCSPHGSPHGTPRNVSSNGGSVNKTPRRASESSALDFEDDTESVGSDRDFTQKRADVSWKEVPDDGLFQNGESGRPEASRKETPGQNPADDTDEGRGTLVTDGEGNPAHSSAEDELPTKSKRTSNEKDIAVENSHLKSTIDGLQEQVAQLQEAMLSLSDRILNRSRSDVNLDTWDGGDELKLISESQEVSMLDSPPQKLVEAEPENSDPLLQDPALSARGEVPQISLKNALTTLQSALSEDELWALCEQAGHWIKSKPLKQYLALETTYIRKDGRVEFSDLSNAGAEIDEMYLAPEVLEDKSAATVKSSVFSLSVVLWSAADWEMSAEQAPQLSQELESLLVVMSQDDIGQRAEVDDVIRICEDHHAKAGVNSLCVCSSIFAEVEDALLLAKTGKLNQKKIAQEVSKEKEMLIRAAFKENVVPDINSCTWRSNLKSASERVLSARRHSEPTPYEKLMNSLGSSKPILRRSPRPKVFTVRDMFLKDPELVQKLNILPGQRRKNQKAMRLVLRRQSPKDPSSAPMPGVPTPPRALRAGVSETTNANGLSSVILRWHPAKIYDKHGQDAKEEKIIGYRIYVNGHPKGMVAGTKSRALLEGLRQSTEYRVNVRALSALGESDVSNTVIAHITSSPMSRRIEHSGFENEHWNSESTEKRSGLSAPKQPAGLPIAPPRKGPTVPQAKPRLGAVFPKQAENEKSATVQKTLDAKDSRTNAEEKSGKGDDIIDRVLRRYGIQQAAAVVPGFASGSTLSPIPTSYRPTKSSISTETNRRSLQGSLLEDLTKSLETSSISSKGSTTTSESPARDGKKVKIPADIPTASQNSGDVTSKSLELLEQLKSELLS